jgi:hypothetical protein
MSENLSPDTQCSTLTQVTTTEAVEGNSFLRHCQIRDRIRQTLTQLKTEGVTLPELIECMNNETHLLLLEDANAEDLTRPGAGSSLPTDR